MAIKKIELKFNSFPQIGDYVDVIDSVRFSFKSIRENPFEVRTNSVSGYEMANRFFTAFITDMIDYETYSPICDGNVFSYEIDDTIVDVSDIIVGSDVIDLTIIDIDGIKISLVTIDESDSNKCDTCKVTVQTNIPFDKIHIIGDSVDEITFDPAVSSYEFDFLRSNNLLLTKVFSYDTSSIDSDVRKVLNKINHSDVISNVTVTPFGGFIKVNVNNTTSVQSVMYSLDPSLFPYTINNILGPVPSGVLQSFYIKDNGGCQLMSSIHVPELPAENNLLIPKINSIRFANILDIDYCDDNNIPEYLNSNDKLNQNDIIHNICQYVNSCDDDIKIQFRTGYDSDDITIKLYNAVNNSFINDVDFIKKSNFTNIKVSMNFLPTILDDLGYGNYRTGLYFLSGNIFNYDTGAVIDTFDLNGELPNFAKVGNWININDNYYEIISLDFIDNKWMIIVEGVAVTSTILKTIYNEHNYEVFEFNILEIDERTDFIYCEVISENASYGKKISRSDIISIKPKNSNTLRIDYWSNSNKSNILYSTDIKHFKRLKYKSISDLIENDSDLLKGDNSINSFNVDNYELREFVFEPLPIEQMRSLVLALSSDNVYINNQKYTKKEITSKPIGSTNLSEVTVTMYKAENKQLLK